MRLLHLLQGPLPVLVILALAAPVARPSHVTVPDQYTTIQSALDAGADTVQVRDGFYDEALVYAPSVPPPSPVLMPFPSTLPFQLTACPSVRSLAAQSDLTVGGFRFRGPVSISYPHEFRFESCRMDSGLTANGVAVAVARGCLVFGEVVIGTTFAEVDITECSVIGGGVHAGAESRCEIRDNYVAGPALVGIALSADAHATVSGNTVVGTTDGVVLSVHTGQSLSVSDNWVQDCPGSAFRILPSGPASATLEGNHALRCGAAGIETLGPFSTLVLAGNVVDSVGGAGIHVNIPGDWATSYSVTGNVVQVAGGPGIWMATDAEPYGTRTVMRNRVTGAGAEGIRVSLADSLADNVVGRCAGAGIVVDASAGTVLRGNTTYENQGSGLLVHGAPGDALDHNLGAANRRYGLEWTGTGLPALGCNDWFANTLGPVWGVTVGGSDLAVNPLFCDVARDSVGLSADSPLANAPGCGLIGARGIECAVPAAAVDAVESPTSRLRITPQPSTGAVQLAWGALQRAAALEVFDAAGARRWHSLLPAGAASLRWEAMDQDGRALPPGVYFVRLIGAGRVETRRIVLVR